MQYCQDYVSKLQKIVCIAGGVINDTTQNTRMSEIGNRILEFGQRILTAQPGDQYTTTRLNIIGLNPV